MFSLWILDILKAGKRGNRTHLSHINHSKIICVSLKICLCGSFLKESGYAHQTCYYDMPLQRFPKSICFRFLLLFMSILKHFFGYNCIKILFFKFQAWNRKTQFNKYLTRIQIWVNLLKLIRKFCLVFHFSRRIGNSWFHWFVLYFPRLF